MSKLFRGLAGLCLMFAVSNAIACSERPSSLTSPTALTPPPLFLANDEAIGQCLGGMHAAMCQSAGAVPAASGHPRSRASSLRHAGLVRALPI